MMVEGFLPGDVIKAERWGGVYYHFGVYVGNNEVVHFSSTSSNEMDSASADIIRTSLSAFAKGDPLRIDSQEKSVFSREEIVERALASLHTKMGTYNIVSNNCEHFANWCKSGKLVSNQKDLYEKLGRLFWSFTGRKEVIITPLLDILGENEKKVQSFYDAPKKIGTTPKIGTATKNESLESLVDEFIRIFA